ncbi:hypothetical protein AJ80_08151 [Polytolypa hystricis UAMH7299]|uniref:Small ribosomal subunit protein mS41 n=1 Tax=Polytolypa hystricis (strain UAMH7299) TaxID=1447883 RepID=A0A2B7XCX7_POLH7|nr:hypothetical protein AJ80_08151 [Polytolypa hystricis UAMH7299]
MVIRSRGITSLSSSFIGVFRSSQQCRRYLHKNVIPGSLPRPTPFVPDTETFLKLIGRGMSKYTSKIPSWEALFTMSSQQLRDQGIENTRERRYLLRWREKFRRAEYGIGGDLDRVKDGVAELRVVEVPIPERRPAVKTSKTKRTWKQPADLPTGTATLAPGMRWAIANLRPGQTLPANPKDLRVKKYAQIRLHRGNLLKGPYLQFVKGTNGTAAQLTAQEGMWEHKLGRKIDGGERRRAEVRAKMRSEERKKAQA